MRKAVSSIWYLVSSFALEFGRTRFEIREDKGLNERG